MSLSCGALSTAPLILIKLKWTTLKSTCGEYSASKKVCLQPDIVEYDPGGQVPMYDLIVSKQTLHNIGVVLDIREKTIQIDKILLPMRNIANLQLKPSITRVLSIILALLRS